MQDEYHTFACEWEPEQSDGMSMGFYTMRKIDWYSTTKTWNGCISGTV
ncbi:MAG: hypothetical protein ACLVCH_07010 [Roseburia inulinivorans]